MKSLFIDESGDLGKKGRYFVIAMLAPQDGKRIVNFMRDFCAEKGIQEVKASQLTFPQKQFLFNKLCSFDDYSVSYIVADKTNIDNKKLFNDKNLLYNYLLSFLVRKSVQNSNEDVNILLDNHSIKVRSVNSLVDYIRIKAYTQWDFKGDLSLSYVDSKDSKLIQAADLISNAIYWKYVHGKTNIYNMLQIEESIKFPHDKFDLDLTEQPMLV